MTLTVKATVASKVGTIELEGSPEAVSAAIRRLEEESRAPIVRKPLKGTLVSLLAGGFFVTPRSLAEIKGELSNRRVDYNPASLFPVLYKDFLKAGKLWRRGNRGSFLYCSKRGGGPQ